MPLPLDHTFFWPPRKYSADERWTEDTKIGIQGDRPPYLKPGTFYVYFSRSDAGPSGGIYNLSPEDAELVIGRLQEDREMSFESLLDGIHGAGYAYRNEDIKYIPETAV